jgi:hypothetical protein
LPGTGCGIVNANVLHAFNNDGIVGGTLSNTPIGSFGFLNEANGTVGAINNGATGVIEGTFAGIYSAGSTSGLSSSTSIATLANEGVIHGGTFGILRPPHKQLPPVRRPRPHMTSSV